MFKLKRIRREDGNKMNVIWTKDKLRKIYSKDSVTLHAHASGDGAAPARCCRLCGGDKDLRCLGDTYVWEGTEEKYDQLLFDCFGVRVQRSDCLICEWCVRQLRSTEKFRALVHAAFHRSPSEGSSKTLHVAKSEESRTQMEALLDRENELIQLIRAKELAEQKKRRIKHKFANPNPVCKRANVACSVCRQRYPMIIPEDGCKKFVCSRCKQNGDRLTLGCKKYNMAMPSNLLREHLELHAKTDLRGKSRLRSLLKKPLSQPKTMETPKKEYSSKYRCNLCPRRFTQMDHLATHMRTVHGEVRKHVCSTCHKDFLTPKLLDEHLKTNCEKPFIYQCRKCLKVFSNKRTLQTHLIDHMKIS